MRRGNESDFLPVDRAAWPDYAKQHAVIRGRSNMFGLAMDFFGDLKNKQALDIGPGDAPLF